MGEAKGGRRCEPIGGKRFVPSFATVLQRFAPCVLRWKTLRVSPAPHPAGFESRPMGGKKARYREGNGFFKLNGAPSGMSACGCAARFRCGASRLACCAGKRCAFPQLRTLPGSNPGPWAAKSPLPGG